MGLLQFSNNATTTLASPISSSATSCVVSSGTGALFPALSGSQYFQATLVKAGTPSVFEIVRVTARSTDAMTIVRGQEGTTPQSWATGDAFNIFITAGDFAQFAQLNDLQAQAGNYSSDGGSGANVYAATLTPALTAYVVGAPVRVKIAHTNTGTTCTLAVNGLTAITIKTSEGVGPPVGSLVAGGIYEFIYDGANFQVMGVHAISFSQIAGSIANGQVPASAVTQWQASLAITMSQVSGSIPAAQVPEAAVTQFQGNLAISMSQVSGSIPAAQVPEAAVTQYQAALSIGTGQLTGSIPTSSLSGALPGNATWPANITISGTMMAAEFNN